MRPQIGLPFKAALQTSRPEPTVRLLAGQHRINPTPRVLNDLIVLQHITQVTVSLQPIRQLLPTAVPLSLRISPGIAFKLAPLGYLWQPPRHALRLQLKLMAQPPFRRNAADP